MTEQDIITIYKNAYSKLNNIQKANTDYSVCWKKTSKQLFDQAIIDEIEFIEAVVWCGRIGYVLRSVKKERRKTFSDWLYKKQQNIRNGSFSIFEEPFADGKNPISWISKICHIINPSCYPIIYDSHIRKIFKIKIDIDFNYVSGVIKKEIEKDSLSDDEIYLRDSSLWAL